MFGFNYASDKEIKENRIKLRNLFPESRLLDYLDVCALGEKKSYIIYLSNDSEKQEEYERRFGDFTAPMFSLYKYNMALKSAIKNLKLFQTMRTI